LGTPPERTPLPGGLFLRTRQNDEVFRDFGYYIAMRFLRGPMGFITATMFLNFMGLTIIIPVAT